MRGVSSNYNYENVRVEIKVTGTMQPVLRASDNVKQELEETLIVKCNVAGNGSNSHEEDLTYRYEKLFGFENLNGTYSVESVSGKVVPVK